MNLQDDNQYFSVELSNSELGLTDGASFSAEEYSGEFSDSSFSTPMDSTDPDSDGFGIGVDPNEYKNLQDELLERNSEDMQELFQDYVEDHFVERIVESALCDELADHVPGQVGGAVVGEACSNFVVDDSDRSETETFVNAYECHLVEDEILNAETQSDQEEAIGEFDANDCGSKIAPLHECLDVADVQEARECASELGPVSHNYGDSDNDDIPAAIDSSEPEASIEFVGDSSGLHDSGSEAHAEYFDIEGNDYFSTEPANQPTELDYAYCEESSDLSMYEQDQLYSAEANACMAEHTDDPQLAAEYASLASQNLVDVPSGHVSFALEESVSGAAAVAEELDYSYDADPVDDYQLDQPPLESISETDVGSFEDSYCSSNPASDYSSMDSSGDSLDAGSTFDNASTDFGSNDNTY